MASGCARRGCSFHSPTGGGKRDPSPPLLPFPSPWKGQGRVLAASIRPPMELLGPSARRSCHSRLLGKTCTIPIAPSIPPPWGYPGLVPPALSIPSSVEGQGPGARLSFHSCAGGVIRPVPAALFAPMEELGAGPPTPGCHKFSAGGDPKKPENPRETCSRSPLRPHLPMLGSHCRRVASRHGPPAGASCRQTGRPRQPKSQQELTLRRLSGTFFPVTPESWRIGSCSRCNLSPKAGGPDEGESFCECTVTGSKFCTLIGGWISSKNLLKQE